MELSSPVFENGENIPAKYTCDGDNINPPLKIRGVPEEARSLALLVDDPDAPSGTFVHWVLYDIAPDTEVILENTQPGTSGTNSFQQDTYGGPCPPSGTHRYFFKLYALDRTLDTGPGKTKEQLLQAMDGHILEEAELIGLYERAC